jgi:hypothetical protein
MLTTVFYPSIGGRESHIHNISKELIKQGYTVKIIFPTIGEGQDEIYTLDGIEVHKLSLGNSKDQQKYEGYKKKSKGMIGYLSGYLRKYYYNRFCKQVEAYIEKDRMHSKANQDEVLIHQHDFISGVKLSKKLAKRYPIVFTNHTGEFLFLKKLPFNELFIRYLTSHFDYVISPSTELNQFKGVREEGSYTYLPNGVDVEIFSPVEREEKSMLRGKYNLPQNQIVLLCPRRWAPTKGILYLAKAMAIMVKTFEVNDFVVAFAGNDYEDYPEYKKEVQGILVKEQLQKHVMLLGNLPYDQMQEITKACDAVIIPSLMEAVSLSMLEAMACGKIVVGSNTGGIPEVIVDGENGYLVPKANEKELAKTLVRVVKTFENLDNIQQKAVQTVEKDYTWKVITKQVEEIYQKVWSARNG